MRQVGIPFDIIRKLNRRKRKPLDLNVVWAAVEDAIEFLNSVIDSETPAGRNWRKKYPKEAQRIARYETSLKFYRRLQKEVIREGNKRGWR